MGELIDSLVKLDRSMEVSLSFLPVEGGHHGPGMFDIPFSVNLNEDDFGKVVHVSLIEEQSAAFLTLNAIRKMAKK